MNTKYKIKNNEYKVPEKDKFLFNLKNANSHNIIGKSKELKNDIDKLLKYESLVQKSERPDIIFYDGTNIIGIEQMDFSSYNCSKKGNIELKKYNETFNTTFEKFVDTSKNILKNKLAVLKSSNEYYENSFINIFDKHYNKVEAYFNNLKKFNKPIKLYFLMSNISLKNTIAKYKENGILYNPTYNKKILEHLRGRNKINGLIFEEPFYEKKDYYYLENNNENIENLLKKNENYFNYKIINQKLKIVTFCGGINL